MVNDLGSEKRAAKFPLHQNTVLSHIAMSIRLSVLRH